MLKIETLIIKRKNDFAISQGFYFHASKISEFTVNLFLILNLTEHGFQMLIKTIVLKRGKFRSNVVFILQKKIKMPTIRTLYKHGNPTVVIKRVKNGDRIIGQNLIWERKLDLRGSKLDLRGSKLDGRGSKLDFRGSKLDLRGSKVD